MVFHSLRNRNHAQWGVGGRVLDGVRLAFCFFARAKPALTASRSHSHPKYCSSSCSPGFTVRSRACPSRSLGANLFLLYSPTQHRPLLPLPLSQTITDISSYSIPRSTHQRSYLFGIRLRQFLRLFTDLGSKPAYLSPATGLP